MHSFYRPHKRVQFKNELVNGATGEVTTPPSMTKQEFKRECDINNIIKAYSTSGMLNHVSAKAKLGQYLDLPDDVDFQASVHIIQQAEASFMTLPSSLRDRFHQNPAEFLEFMHNPQNTEEIYKLGLATRPAPTPTESYSSTSTPESSEPPPKSSKSKS